MIRNSNDSKGIQKIKFQGTGLTPSERKWGKKQFNGYRKKYHIETLSDVQVLEELVFREALQERYKTKIGTLAEDTKQDGKNEVQIEIIPKSLLSALNTNLEQILILREKLGLFEEKKGHDPHKYIQILKKKFEMWKDEHIEERKVTCPFCSEIFFLNIRTDKYQESKLKLYKNKVLTNEHLWKCYKEGKITKEDMASILNVSLNYIDWLQEKIYNLPS